jgi:hypothetical protein
VVVDVVGYFEPRHPDTREGRIVPVAEHARVLDTRTPEFGSRSLGPGFAEDWSFREVTESVQVNGTQIGPQAGFLGILTATNLRPQRGWFGPMRSYLTVYPNPGALRPPPVVSSLNLSEGASVPNLSVFRFGSGAQSHQVRVYNFNGNVDYVVDLVAVVLADH